MDHFQYKGGRLHAEDVALATIAEQVGTPCYVYSSNTIERHYKAYEDAFAGLPMTICYAVKANSNQAVIKTLADLGAGADVVSGGELKRALKAGVPAAKVVFSGVGKTRQELTDALNAGVMQINVESESELELLSDVAQGLGATARVGIRVNPDVDAKTHEKISTGKKENKFGIEWTRAQDVFARASQLPAIQACGVAVHIGSQLTDLAPYQEAYTRVRDLVAMLRADGHVIDRIDLGGGLGIFYGEDGQDAAAIPTPRAYAAMVQEVLGTIGCDFVIEPGRSIVGNAGVLLTSIIHVKDGSTKNFLIVDAAMNDLIRPTLYTAHHAIVPVKNSEASEEAEKTYDIVGPICETGDTLGTNRKLPATLTAGNLLAVRTAGAYGAVQASSYNTRPLIAEVMVKNDQFHTVRPRIEVETLIEADSIPNWLGT